MPEHSHIQPVEDEGLEKHLGEVFGQALEDAHGPYHGLTQSLATPYNKDT